MKFAWLLSPFLAALQLLILLSSNGERTAVEMYRFVIVFPRPLVNFNRNKSKILHSELFRFRYDLLHMGYYEGLIFLALLSSARTNWNGCRFG
jgi:hypothetical protein